MAIYPYPYDQGFGETIDVWGTPIPATAPDLSFGGPMGGIVPMTPPGYPTVPQYPGPMMQPQPAPEAPFAFGQFDFDPRQHLGMPLLMAGSAMMASGDDLTGGLGRAGAAFGQTMGQEKSQAYQMWEDEQNQRLKEWEIKHGLRREGVLDKRYEEETARDIEKERFNRARIEKADADAEAAIADQREADISYIEENAPPEVAQRAWILSAPEVADIRKQIEDEEALKKAKELEEWKHKIEAKYREPKETKSKEIMPDESLAGDLIQESVSAWTPPTTFPKEISVIRDVTKRKQAQEKFIEAEREKAKAIATAQGLRIVDDPETGGFSSGLTVEDARFMSKRMKKIEAGVAVSAADYSNNEIKTLAPVFKVNPREVVAALLAEGLAEEEIVKIIERLNKAGGRQTTG